MVIEVSVTDVVKFVDGPVFVVVVVVVVVDVAVVINP